MAATFLAALMWRGLVNSVALATTTHRKMEGMSNGAGTQVKVQMINKCKALMTSRGLYKKGSPHEEGDGEKKGNLEQKNSVRTIAFEQRPIYLLHVSSN